jgi:hypothetical protein
LTRECGKLDLGVLFYVEPFILIDEPLYYDIRSICVQLSDFRKWTLVICQILGLLLSFLLIDKIKENHTDDKKN